MDCAPVLARISRTAPRRCSSATFAQEGAVRAGALLMGCQPVLADSGEAVRTCAGQLEHPWRINAG